MKAFRPTLIAALLLIAGAVQAQQLFNKPDDAAQALVNAINSHDQAALQQILGKDWRRYLPAHGVDQQDVSQFLNDWRQSHHIEQSGNRAHISVGDDDWVLPLPLAKTANGWQFDLPAATAEIRERTIGRNELSTMQAVAAYADAQREYYAQDHNGDGVREYAQKLISSPDKQDGLYWPTTDGAPTSPLGPAFGNDSPGSDYHGYYYRILNAQGAQASGGAYSYLQNGLMTKGFALIAWPVSYGNSGVFSFMINQDGTVYQKDLGDNTDRAARQIKTFNPDGGWTKTALPQSAAQAPTNQ